MLLPLLTATFYRRLTAYAALIVISASITASCRRGTPVAVRVPALAEGYDTRLIDAHSLAEDPCARHRVLAMTWREVAGRLGALTFAEQAHLSMSENGNAVMQQAHTVSIKRDGQGHQHLVKETAPHRFELITHDDRVYVRQDRGHIRLKAPRDMDTDKILESAFQGLLGTLQQFAGVSLADPREDVVEGREAVRYTLEQKALELPVPAIPPAATLDVAPPPRWREEVVGATLSGRIWVDVETGVVVRTNVQGELPLVGQGPERKVLSLRYASKINQVGRTLPIDEPEGAVAEFRRPIRPRDPLNFFHAAQRSTQPHPAADSSQEQESDEGTADASPDALEGTDEGT